jgi:undecaprenyl diphosphate synthase
MKSKLESQLIKGQLPKHIAIIMDGNGRWANKRGLNRIRGHQEGMKSVKSVIKAAHALGIKAVTLYAFSVQNWRRPESEVNSLMKLLKEYLIKEGRILVDKGIRLKVIGRIGDLPKDVREVLEDIIEKTRSGEEMTLTLALSYGGREEIIDAVREMISKRDLSPNDVSVESFSRYLHTSDLPELDLLIRTSGEMRVSNFLLWQIAYAEIYVTSTLWPDFRRRHLIKALLHYQNRERRFGLTSEQIRKREAL